MSAPAMGAALTGLVAGVAMYGDSWGRVLNVVALFLLIERWFGVYASLESELPPDAGTP